MGALPSESKGLERWRNFLTKTPLEQETASCDTASLEAQRTFANPAVTYNVFASPVPEESHTFSLYTKYY